MDEDMLFPKIKKGIEDFMEEEEGNISRSKIAMIGSMMLIMGFLMADGNVFAAHRSHSSHSSHSSHRSHSSHSSGSHSSHASHSSGSHSNHSSGGSISHSSGSTSAASGSALKVNLPSMQVPKPTPDMD